MLPDTKEGLLEEERELNELQDDEVREVASGADLSAGSIRAPRGANERLGGICLEFDVDIGSEIGPESGEVSVSPMEPRLDKGSVGCPEDEKLSNRLTKRLLGGGVRGRGAKAPFG